MLRSGTRQTAVGSQETGWVEPLVPFLVLSLLVHGTQGIPDSEILKFHCLFQAPACCKYNLIESFE